MDNIQNLKEIAREIRKDIVQLLYEKQTCHLGSDLSCVDILVALYFNVLKDEDIFIMSKGHGAAALYLTLAKKGIIDREELFREYATDAETKYLNLVDRKAPGVFTSTGSLGHGLPVAVGVALADRDTRHRTIYCLISDGELNCGTTWESFNIARCWHNQLDNLVVIVDKNKYQATGRTDNILNLVDPFTRVEVAGHDMEALVAALNHREEKTPMWITADTVKGHGVSFAENNNDWHYNNLTKELYEQAMRELETNPL